MLVNKKCMICQGKLKLSLVREKMVCDTCYKEFDIEQISNNVPIQQTIVVQRNTSESVLKKSSRGYHIIKESFDQYQSGIITIQEFNHIKTQVFEGEY